LKIYERVNPACAVNNPTIFPLKWKNDKFLNQLIYILICILECIGEGYEL
jgi:hypothetical protein